MKVSELVRRARSVRRFHQDRKVPCDTLKDLVDLARLSASASNLQPLKYLLSCDPDNNRLVFPCLGWAGYLANWHGPAEGERPAAYIVALGDTTISQSFDRDLGIAVQSVMLGATEKKLSGCIIGSVNREDLQEALNIPKRFEILVVIAMGYPKEKVILESVGSDGNVRYWRDDDGNHHVPKRRLEDIIVTTSP